MVEKFNIISKDVIKWIYNNSSYEINRNDILKAHCFEMENTILIVCGKYYVETHLYAYDIYGNFKFEVIPPKDYEILWGRKVALNGKNVMGMACQPMRGDGALYAIDPTNGTLTYAGIIRI